MQKSLLQRSKDHRQISGLAGAKETERARRETSCQENSGATVSNKDDGQSI